MAKRILIAAGLFPPDIGGPATYAAMLADELPRRGFDTVVAPYGQIRHHPKVWRHLAYARLLWRESRRADAIYALDPMSVGLPALIVARLRRLPFLVRLGGDYAWEQGVQRFGVSATLDEYTEHPTTYGWRVRLFAWLQRAVVSRASLVIVPSQYLRRIVTRWRGVDPARIQVVYSALFPLSTEAPRDQLRRELSYEGFVLVTACRLAPWKGVDGLIRTVAKLAGSIPDISLVVAGDGPERAHLEALARALGVSDRVRFVGGLSKEALGAALKAADLFVLNTAYEGLSHQLLEVMDLGVPVITTRVGGNPELIQDGENGRLIAYQDEAGLAAAITQLHRDPSLRARYAAAARERLSQFDRQVSIDTLTESLDTLL